MNNVGIIVTNMGKEASFFEFRDYRFNRGFNKIEFYYRIYFEDRSFEDSKEALTLSISNNNADPDQKEAIERVIKDLFLITGISYYKRYCPTTIRIVPFSLSSQQALFWNRVYTRGLGEFFFKNRIDFRGLIKFPYKRNLNQKSSRLDVKNAGLLALGGGKDSIVSAEILKKGHFPFKTIIGNFHLHKQVAQAIGKEYIQITRVTDKKILEKALYNGHIPISAIYSFQKLLVASMLKYRYCIFSTEKSADYGNTTYLGETINHQWSKSEEFENLLKDYVKDNISPDIELFSLLRPLFEIEIVKRFAKHKKYFSIFSSCNAKFRIDKKKRIMGWCSKCPKCAFVFCLLSAFIKKEELISIFGKNLFADFSLISTYEDLLGIGSIKPFECVGTSEETRVAFFLAMGRGEYINDIAMKMFEKKVLPKIKDITKLEREVFLYGDDSHIPKRFVKVLKAGR